MAQIDLKDVVIKIKDGNSGEVEVKIGEGNLVYTERRNLEYIPNGGLLDEVREGDEVPVEVRLDAKFEYYSSNGSDISPKDALKGTGGASGWTSTDADACRPFAVDLEITNTVTPDGCGDDEVITLADFRYEEISFDLRNGTISISGQCNVVEATGVRS